MSRGSSGFSLVVTSGSMNVAETYGNIGFNQYLDQAIKHQAWYLNAYRCWISINLILMGFPGNILKRIILLGYINHPSIFHAAIKVKTIYDAFFIHSRDGTISRYETILCFLSSGIIVVKSSAVVTAGSMKVITTYGKVATGYGNVW